MANKGRPAEDLYKKWVAGKEDAIVAACRQGADNEGLSKVLGCGKTTLGKLIKNFENFRELIKESKLVADAKVEAALYRRAIGYDYEETTTRVLVGENGAGNITQITKVKKHIAPDTTAQIFWLKNRKPETWRDKQEMDITVNPFLELMKEATSDE